MTGSRPKLREVVVVEGLHDKQRVDEAVDAEVLVLGGDRVSRRTLDLLRRAVAVRGAIVLTDPDGAGERIRRRLDQLVPGLRHAYLRKGRAVSSRGVGIEHASAEDVRRALLAAQSGEPAASDTARDEPPPFTLDDLARHRLAHHPDAARRREKLGERLGIGYGNAKAFLHKLNAYRVTREAFEEAVRRLDG
ncbi:ribonuclease M5 [Alicyclobacillus sendaiensis]|uniref:Ribonuclease M5 n=1 Tax=Alicyclobacillus sendaiensis PA2 TaxID=3029425 RepID=A0ABT6XZ83_ALISE|nr:ribonuclease M5 [Alicyclobacillus sendaiensis]MDI9260396.1 ribonuclease M5 [Alicyclobacillus sendaiensis PA2]